MSLVTGRLGLSLEMGAFVAGLTVTWMPDIKRSLASVAPLSRVFGGMFFASVGMLVSPVGGGDAGSGADTAMATLTSVPATLSVPMLAGVCVVPRGCSREDPDGGRPGEGGDDDHHHAHVQVRPCQLADVGRRVGSDH